MFPTLLQLYVQLTPRSPDVLVGSILIEDSDRVSRSPTESVLARGSSFARLSAHQVRAHVADYQPYTMVAL
jgi:hypothetical protein